jgi:hypothetical protein
MRTKTPPRLNGLNQIGRALSTAGPRNLVIAAVLIVALLAFEIFNFDTTRYALTSLLGEVSFAGWSWAAILALAFCAIDFAGLARLFTPEQGRDEPREIWFLMGAWLLGATMNAVMTWWAVSLTLLNHDLGNEVLSREQLLRIVPIFVAVLVWLTRILFIGSLTMAGEHLFDFHGRNTADHAPKTAQPPATRPQSSPAPTTRQAPVAPPVGMRRPATAAGFSGQSAATPAQFSGPIRDEAYEEAPRPTGQPVRDVPQPTSRIQRRPPVGGTRPGMPVGMQAKNRN